MNGSVPKVIVIGASAGALEALTEILPLLPADYAVPIVIVVHVPPDKKSIMAELLHDKCRIHVQEAEDKDIMKLGTAYLAPPDYHVLIEMNGTLSLSNEEPELYSRPSIDALFETAADAYGDQVIGVILSGANSDGAKGLYTVMAAGGEGLIQDFTQAYATAMPQAAARLCPQASILSLQDIALYLQKAGIR